jgi:DNA gyrase subunit A
MRFHEKNVRKMGRTAAGVRGIKMPEENDSVIGLIVVGEGSILSATKNGYGKRTAPEGYPTKGRGGMGVIDIKTTERNGPVIGAVQVRDDDEIMLITDAGTLVRTAVSEVSTVGRNTQGVRLIRLTAGESLVELTAIDEEDAQDEDEVADSAAESVSEPGSEAEAASTDDADSGNDDGSDSGVDAGDSADDETDKPD